ncbi:hypothetical protein GCM10023170_078880 [Phytohabitans houttuyneae]|uniref:DUF2637 domain-containing protein n=1 Tax=Phytohabitans houttuyneae TaxID=1076126 RepID=UPI0031F09DEC
MTGPETGTSRSGRGWAYAGVALGGCVSVAANVAATFIPPPDATAGWSPPVGGVVSAVCWPVLLLVAVELFARILWPAGWRWWLLRAAGLLPVAVIAAVVSYRHLSKLLRFYGEDPVTATLGPLAVDGLMVMATGALLAARGTREHRAPVATRSGSAGSPERRRVRTAPAPTGLAAPRRGGTRSPQRTDADLVDVLKRVKRDRDGTVPVRRAAKALGTGPDRARRLLRDAGLLRVPPAVPDPPVRATPTRDLIATMDPPPIDVQESDVR